MDQNKKSRIKIYDDIGKVEFRHSTRAKYIKIRLKPAHHVLVILPEYSDVHQGEKVLLSKIEWVKKHQDKFAEENKVRTIFTENTHFNTCRHKLNLYKRKDAKDFILVQVAEGMIHVGYPTFLGTEDERVQKSVRNGIEHAWRIEAHEYIIPRTSEYAEQLHLQYNKITIKNLKSRWGSCSGRNNLNFNLHLMRLPIRLIDYVILHELCHTKEKNHGPGFWNLLHIFTDGKAKALDKELSTYHTEVY